MKKALILAVAVLLGTVMVKAQTHTGTYQVVQQMLENTKPQCAFRSDMQASEMAAWRQSVSDAMAVLMQHPEVPADVAATMVSSEQMDGYSRQMWKTEPLPGCEVTFTVLMPDNAKKPLPAVLCIPGSGMTMAYICDTVQGRGHFATDIVRAGYIAVAVDNAAAGTQQDEGLSKGACDYVTPSRILLELGWSWLGYTSYIDRCILQWMKQQPAVRRDRICVAGFSLGTEPLMVLGALDSEIHAFVYNDFLCNTQERAIVLTKDGNEWGRPFPNNIRHLIPGWWRFFNFPDVVASLAPRPVILTEGGMDRDFNLIRKAYELSGHPENVELHHYAKFAPDSMRTYLDEMPRNIDRDTYFRLANVDPPSHYFKSELIIPWLKKVLAY